MNSAAQSRPHSMSFRKKPSPMPADFRYTWRIGVVALILSEGSRGATTSMPRFHILAWAIRDSARRNLLVSALSSGLAQPFVPRYESAWTRAVAYAFAENLVNIRVLSDGGSRLTLTDAGWAFANDLEKAGVLREETKFLRSIKSRATEGRIRALAASGGSE